MVFSSLRKEQKMENRKWRMENGKTSAPGF
jgi:hypothetical protein